MATTEAPEAAYGTPAAPPPPSPEVIASMTLAERLARITAEVGPVSKSGRNAHFGYSYQRAEDVGAAVAPLLGRYGVSITPRIAFDEVQVTDTGRTTKSGAPIREYAVPIHFLISCPNGADLVPWLALAIDDSDKGVNKAITAAVKSFLRAQFLIPTGDEDTDSDSGSRTAADGGGGGRQWDGAMPEVEDMAGVSGTVFLNDDETHVGIKFRAESDADFASIKDTVRAMGARWNGEGKVWAMPAGQAGQAVTLGRYLGLSINSTLAERFPEKPADDLAQASEVKHPTGGPGGGDGTDPGDDDILF